MAMIFASARSNENYKASGSKLGDQRQTSSTNDMSGEISMQNDYDHSKGWYLYRPKDAAKANLMAKEMIAACNNPLLGYNQDCHQDLIEYIKDHKIKSFADIKVKVDDDCSGLVAAAVYLAFGVDLNKYAGGNFYTGNAAEAMAKTGLFTRIPYSNKSDTVQYNGDIKVTKTKGHIGMIVKGRARPVSNTAAATTTTTTTATAKPIVKEEREVVSIDLTVLCNGCVGTEVVTAQRLLIASGYSCGKAADDGDFGSATEKAVKAFQADHESTCGKADGIIGRKTWKSLLGA